MDTEGLPKAVPAPRVKFGPGATDDMPPEWAEVMLTLLKAEYPAVFGDLLVRSLGIERRRRRSANGAG